MFYQPDLIIYLWMLPVLAMVILPALWSITSVIYRAVERSRLADVRGFVDVSSFSDSGSVERRINHRVRLANEKKVKVAKLGKCCQSKVLNMSSEGICLKNVPRKIFEETKGSLRVVLRTREQDFSMIVKPKWRKSSKREFMIGAEITNPPSGWREFIETLCKPATMELA